MSKPSRSLHNFQDFVYRLHLELSRSTSKRYKNTDFNMGKVKVLRWFYKIQSLRRAAQDGLLDILKEATKRDCNVKDEDGMTPTLWAAHEGNLDALRLLVGRGGDPEKTNYHFGQNALHMAASKGCIKCVSFLIAFDVNVWALDYDFHTALELAAMNNCYKIVEFLDKVSTKQELTNKRKSDIRKERAQKDVERRLKKYEEKVKKERNKEKKQCKKIERERVDKKIDFAVVPFSLPINKKMPQEPGMQTFTQIVNNGSVSSAKKSSTSVGVKKIIDRKLRHRSQNSYNLVDVAEFEEDCNINTRSSLCERHKYNESRESLFTEPKRGKIKNLFTMKQNLQRSKSQPDLSNKMTLICDRDHESEKFSVYSGDSGSLFDRPGFGSVSFRQSIPVPLSISTSEHECVYGDECSLGSIGSLAKRILPSETSPCETISTNLRVNNEEACGVNFQLPLALHKFLVAIGIGDYEDEFIKQRVDMEALLMLDDDDLTSLGIPMGPRKKLLNAIMDYKQQFQKTPTDF